MSCAEMTQRGPRYTASVVNRGDATYEATTRDSTFLMGTGGPGANPIETLLASLCACIGHYVRDYLQTAMVTSMVASRAPSAVGVAEALTANSSEIFVVDGADLDERQRAELLRSAEHCKIHNTLKAGCDVRIAVADRTAVASDRASARRSTCCS
jgi:uncharacterized OsmC-like protein